MVGILAPPQLSIRGPLLRLLPLPGSSLAASSSALIPASKFLLISSLPSVYFLVSAEHEKPALKVPNA